MAYDYNRHRIKRIQSEQKLTLAQMMQTVLTETGTMPGALQQQPIPTDSRLLDTVPDAVLAYSMRLLRTAHSVEDTTPGSVTFGSTDSYLLQIRRSNDNAVSSFTDTEVTDGTMQTWVGSDNYGYVTIWYDQSGNNLHAIQTTAANQPYAVLNTGQIHTVSGQNREGIFFRQPGPDNNRWFITEDTAELDFTGSHDIFVHFEMDRLSANNSDDRPVVFTKGRAQSNAIYAGISPYSFFFNGDRGDYTYNLCKEEPPDYRSSLNSATNRAFDFLDQVVLINCHWDGTENANSQNVAVDGVAEVSRTMAFDVLNTNTDDLSLGTDVTRSAGTDARRAFRGSIEEFIIYDRDIGVNARASASNNITSYYN
jgi:hypothetical protein